MKVPPSAIEYVVPILHVRDLDTAVAFFEVLGFECQWRWGEPTRIAGMYLSQFVIHIRHVEQAPVAATSLYIQVDNANPFYDYVRERGIKVVEDLQDRPYGMRDFGIAGPEGIHISIGHELEE
jgi:uncharacterized glyoxalase superfamily protein PhnB